MIVGINGPQCDINNIFVGVNGAVIKANSLCQGFNGVVQKVWPSYLSNFADNTWEQIIAACQSNNVPDTWVADGSCYKNMEIDSVSYQIDIIGKNHDTYASGGIAPLTFQLHGCYEKGGEYGSGSYEYGYGNWTDSDVRTNILPGILSLMPEEIKNSIREVIKLSKRYPSIINTNDKLFLLSLDEVNSTRDPSEGTQYNYYAVGNSKIKQAQNVNVDWWTRTESFTSSMREYIISQSGTSLEQRKDDPAYLSFAFCF